MPPKDEAYLKIQGYLEKNKKRLQEENVDFIVWELKTFVPETKELLEGELRATVAIWRSLHGPMYPLSTKPPLTLPESKLIETVKNAITTVIKDGGIKLGRKDAKLIIGVTGVTAELAKGDATLAVRPTWTKALEVEVAKGNLHFSGRLAPDEWQISVSYPEDSFVPDLTSLGKVFTAGEKALRGSLGALRSFDDLLDKSKVEKAVAPAIGPVSDAVGAALDTGKIPRKGGISIGGKIGSPPPMPGQTERPAGVQGVIVITVTW